MNLLRITSVPIKLEYNITKARLEGTNGRPRNTMKTTPAQMDMRAQNIKVQINTEELRKSMGYMSSRDLIKDAAERGMQAAEEATIRYVEEGNQLAQAFKGITPAQALSRDNYQMPETMLRFLPSVGPEISWIPNSLEMNYTPSRVDINWDNIKNSMEYIPWDVKFNVLQYPKVNIEYIGGPNYVPPSADPNYQE